MRCEAIVLRAGSMRPTERTIGSLPPPGFPRLRSIAWVAVLAAALLEACRHTEPSSPATVAENVVFVKTAPKVGRVSVEESIVEFRMIGEGKAKGGAVNRTTTETTERERRREEILSVFDRTVTKKRIAYEQLEKRELHNGTQVPAEKSPLIGHAYVVALEQGSLVLTDVAGRGVSDPEKKDLSRRLAGFGKPDPFLDGIPDGVVVANQPALGMKGGFLEMFEGADEGPDIGNVDVRFVGARDHAQGRCGVFAFKVAIQMAGEPRLSMDLSGEFLIRLTDSAPIQLDARGPARLVGRQKIENVDVQLDGAGEMRTTLRITYL
jgi:hypothetical protein